MLIANDFIKLQYTHDLTQSGIAYATRSLQQLHNHSGNSIFAQLRRSVASVAVDLAFRRYLSEQSISFEIQNSPSFKESDKYHLILGGHRCDVISYLINKRTQIATIQKDINILLSAPALVASEAFASEAHHEQDVYLFAFLLGATALAREDTLNAIAAQQPMYLIHALPREWTHPHSWHTLGELVFKSECSYPIDVEIIGLDTDRNSVTTSLKLQPLTRTVIPNNYFSITYIYAHNLPDARIALHSPTRKETYIINANDWGNIWVYGTDIYLTGIITHEEYRRRASYIQPGARVFQFDETRVKNLALPIEQLYPIGKFLDKLKSS